MSVSLRPELIWVFRIADANIAAKKIAARMKYEVERKISEQRLEKLARCTRQRTPQNFLHERSQLVHREAVFANELHRCVGREIGRIADARQHNDRRLRRFGVVTEALKNLEALHFRQDQLE